ncbi:MAG: acyloxyacyl hydrolase [Alphaproteobacteria bacterium]|nr:acyloxyacyl hydrolase [Alphaproteobacteria bacterium]MBF0249441.1 acyloxyacyl hydrolase [Alphaproteobacteria bacterium]
MDMIRKRLRCFFPALIAAAVFSSIAAAQDILHEVKLGLLAHDVDNLWSGSSRESGMDTNAEFIFAPKYDLLGGEVRPALGVSANSAGDTSKLYAAARWETEVLGRGFFALGIGGAVHDGEEKLVRRDRKALGSRVLFYFPIEAGYRIDDTYSVSLFFDHVSNAWMASPNEGMDTLGLRFGIKF